MAVAFLLVISVALGVNVPASGADARLATGLPRTSQGLGDANATGSIAANTIAVTRDVYEQQDAVGGKYFWGDWTVGLSIGGSTDRATKIVVWVWDVSDPANEFSLGKAADYFCWDGPIRPDDPGTSNRCNRDHRFELTSAELEPGHTYVGRLSVTVSVSGQPQVEKDVEAAPFTVPGGKLPVVPSEQSGPCACPDAQGYALDPVNTATGAFFESFVDVPGVGPGVSGEVARSYASQSSSDVGFGKGWSWLYGSRLDVSTSEVAWRSPDGTVARFKKSGTSWVTPPGASGALTQSSTGFVLRLPGGSEHQFSTSGGLQKVTDADGVGVTVTSSAGVVSKVTDAVGRAVSFTTSGGQVTKARTWDGREVAYGYTSGRLTSVTDVRGKTTAYRYDTSGRLDRVTAPSGRILVENTYDSSGRVTRQIDGAGKAWTLTWDSAGDVATVTDPGGGKWIDTYEGRVLMSKKDPAGNITTFQYDQDLNPVVIDAGGPTQVRQSFDARGNVLTRSAPGRAGAVQMLTYNAKDQVTSRTDYRGNKTAMAYSGNRLASVTSPKGEITKYSWTALGLPSTVTAPKGGVTSMTYDAHGQLATMTAPGGEITSYSYDPAGRVATVADPRSVGAADPSDFTKRFVYDAAGNVTITTATDGAKTSLTYDNDGRLASSQTASAAGAVLTKEVLERDGLDRITKKTDAASESESFTYDSRGNLTAATDASGAKTAYGYDARNLMTSMITPRGNASGATPADFRWTYQYDSRGRMTKETDPTGAATTYARDGYGAPTKITDPDARVTTMAYDADGQLTKVTDALSRVSEYTYDVNGRQVSVKEPGLGARTSAYDADGHVTKTTSPSGSSVTSYAYDANGLLASVTSPRGTATATAGDYETTFERDPAGNLVTSTNALGKSTRSTFDGENRMVTRTTARGGKTTWSHDGLGRALTVTTPSAATTAWTYDNVGNLTKLTNGRGKSTTYTHSPRGEVTASTDPLGRIETFTYDEEGQLVKTVTARGHADGGSQMDKYTIRSGYDARGLRTSITTSSASSSSTSAYSPGGDLTRATDATGTTTMTYDAGHQLTGVASPMGDFVYTYAPWGEVASRTLPNHGAVEFGFDTDGRVTSSKSNTETTTFGYDRDDNLTGITYPAASGLSQTRAYDSVGAATDVHTTKAGSLASRYQYTYDANGNPFRETVSRGSSVTSTSYNHDLDDRLIKECHKATSCTSATDVDTYTYNETSGITRTQYGNGSDTRVEYDDADQPVKLWDANAGAEPSAPNASFDADGYPTGNADGDIEFDPLGRMVKNEPWQASYQYNAFGNRVGVTRNGATTKLAWDNNNPLPMLAQQGPAGEEPTRTYRYDPTGAPLSSTHPSGAYGRSWFVTDRQGSARDVLKTDGATAYRHDYQAFGRQETPIKSATRVAPEMGYTGEYTDTFTGTTHLRARDYLGNGAFFAPDPITLGPPAAASNAYLYVNGRPLTDADPSGRRPIGGTDDVACMNCRLTEDGWSVGNENIVRNVYDKTVGYHTDGGSGLTSVWGNTYSGDDYTGAGHHNTETYVPRVYSRGETIAIYALAFGLSMNPVVATTSVMYEVDQKGVNNLTVADCVYLGASVVPATKLGRAASDAVKLRRGQKATTATGAVTRSLDDVSSLRGASPAEIEDLIPSSWVTSATNAKKGGRGVRHSNPERRGEQVRVMTGKVTDPNPVKQGPYLRISRNSSVSDPIPLEGNPTLP